MVTAKEKMKCLFGFCCEFEWQTKGKTKTFRCTKCGSPHPEYPVLKTITYKKWGYELRDVFHDNAQHGGTGFMVLRGAFTLDGDPIGDKKDANFLCRKRGIKPERRTPTSNICTIGFCESEQKWYGWSHRAIYGFGIGAAITKGSSGYTPDNREAYIETLKKWWSKDDDPTSVKIEIKEDEIHVSREGSSLSTIEPLDIPYGRGEWSAKTLEDCKKMAIAFAESVS